MKRKFFKSKKSKVITIILGILIIIFIIIKLSDPGETRHYASETDTQVTHSITRSDDHVTTAVQQIMIGSKCGSYKKAAATLKSIKDAGYEAIEINDFMIHKTGLTVKLLTKFAGMPVGNGGKLDWSQLIEESGLSVISLHCYLDAIEADPETVAKEAQCFGTDTVVITAMYKYDYSDLNEVKDLAKRLNEAGKSLSKYGIRLLYHNHNVELQKVTEDKTAYDIIIEETDPEYVNFEFDSYWMTDGGANVPALMEKLGTRLKLWHINDRGYKKSGPYMTPILKEDAAELGHGNMDLETLSEIAIKNGVEGVILETHQNWADKNPITSINISSEFMMEHFGDISDKKTDSK